jgi:hypothetical protein
MSSSEDENMERLRSVSVSASDVISASKPALS